MSDAGADGTERRSLAATRTRLHGLDSLGKCFGMGLGLGWCQKEGKGGAFWGRGLRFLDWDFTSHEGNRVDDKYCVESKRSASLMIRGAYMHA